MSVTYLSIVLSRRPKNTAFWFIVVSLFLAIGSICQQYSWIALSETRIREWEDPDRAHHRVQVIYSEMRKDQAGWVIFQMLKAHAYAFSKNATYGGACGDSPHKKDISQVLSSVGWSEILPLRCPSEPGAPQGRVYPSPFFERRHGRRMGQQSWRAEIMRHTDYSYFDQIPGRSSIPMKNSNDSKPMFSIAVHIRRRDVTPCCYPGWYLPNSYFSSMIQYYVQNKAPPDRPLQIQLFSQSQSHESWEDFKSRLEQHPSTKNYTLHLDGPVGNVWRAILAADVFIGSISEFSRVPSLFAKGEIPDPRNITISAIAEQTRLQNKELLNQCTDIQFVSCKHKWWIDGESNFQKPK